MASILRIVGAVTILAGVIAGFLTYSFVGFLIIALGALASAVLFFGLASVLDNQETILYRLTRLEAPERERLEEKVTCLKCGKQYAKTMSYCSWCGYRDSE